MSFTFPKTSRLQRPAEFLNVKKTGTRIRAGGLVISFVLGDKRRLGITVSRRVGNAVERGRIKRVIREFFRQRKEEFPMADIVFVATEGLGRFGNVRIREMIETGLEKIKTRTIDHAE